MGLGLGGLQSGGTGGGGAATSLAAGATGADLTLSSFLSAARVVVTGSTIPANGIYLSAANQLGFASNSALRAFIDVNGVTLGNGFPINFGTADAAAILFRSGAGVISTGAGCAFRVRQDILLGTTLAFSATAPTIVAGAGAAFVAGTSAAFTVGLGGAAQTGTITFPAATTGWALQMTNLTNNASFVLSQTGGNTTTATFACYSRTTGLLINWTASDVAVCTAVAY